MANTGDMRSCLCNQGHGVTAAVREVCRLASRIWGAHMKGPMLPKGRSYVLFHWLLLQMSAKLETKEHTDCFPTALETAREDMGLKRRLCYLWKRSFRQDLMYLLDTLGNGVSQYLTVLK